jgi:uncharacterized membrane protein YphA (DoxX/SURF4 family)
VLIALWIINGLLALAFIFAGITKALTPQEKLLEKGMAWTADYSAPVVKLIGAAEFVGGLGLVLPLLTGIVPVLTPIAATALAVLMSAAVVVHIRRKDGAMMPSLVLGALATVSAVLGFLVVLG